MPNRRRRKLSTAISAVAAVAVASPIALVAVAETTPADTAPQHREFVRAALVTDLPNEVVSALSQGLSQFGVNLPNIMGGASQGSPNPLASAPSAGLTAPGLTSPGLTAPGLTAPGATAPGLTAPGLTSPGLTSPGLTSPGLTSPAGLPSTGGLTTPSSPGMTAPGLGAPSMSPTGLTSPGLSTPSVGTGLSPAGLGGGAADMPMTDPNAGLGLGTGQGLGGSPAGSYPILGDPSAGLGGGEGLGGGGGGGLVSDLTSAANQLGATQAIDLLKGMVMPAIMSAVKSGGAAVPAAAAPAAAAPLAAPIA